MNKRLIAVAMFLVIMGGGVVACTTPSLEPYSPIVLQHSEPAPGALTARFMGVSTLMLSDGKTSIMTDGFFSRPGFWRVALGRIGPVDERITAALRTIDNPPLAAVMVAHAHYDHALDSAVVASRTGAMLIGSTSVARIGSGAGLPAERIKTVDKQPFEFGEFTVKAFQSPHSPGARYPGNIETALIPPARASEYKEGGNYSYLIEQHDGLKILIHPSANFTKGLFNNVKADVVFLGIGFLGKQDIQFARDYWHEVVQVTGARLVIPIHWDYFFEPLDKGLHPMPAWMDPFEVAMQRLMPLALADGVALRMMPLFKVVDLKAALPAQ